MRQQVKEFWVGVSCEADESLDTAFLLYSQPGARGGALGGNLGVHWGDGVRDISPATSLPESNHQNGSRLGDFSNTLPASQHNGEMS